MANDGGISRLQKRFAAIPKAVREAVAPDLERSGNEMAGMMKHLVPVDEGDLKDSIAVTGPGERTPAYSQPGGSMVVPENAVAITVGNADVRYGHLIEYGWTKAAAQPYFWPAVRLLRKRATNRIKRGISKAVKQNWGGS